MAVAEPVLFCPGAAIGDSAHVRGIKFVSIQTEQPIASVAYLLLMAGIPVYVFMKWRQSRSDFVIPAAATPAPITESAHRAEQSVGAAR